MSRIKPTTDYYFRVTYEITPTRAIHYADYQENGVETYSSSDLILMVQRDNPTWKIKKIERMLRGVAGWVSRDDG